MNKLIVALAAGISLSACSSGNPFTEDEGTTTDGSTDAGSGITSDRVVPPGTGNASAQNAIFRSEPTSTEEGRDGDGFATDIIYDSVNDTFTVDNLAFDGDNTYARVTTTNVQNSIPYAVYEADATFPDAVTGALISQIGHRAIYGVSTSGNTQFAIVRTGDYVDFGFGGFVYQRDNDVTLPSSGQAAYTGQVAGIRDRLGGGGIDFTTADMDIAIDFDDFNATTETRGDAVRGLVYNRRILDIDGNDITATVLNRVGDNLDVTLNNVPDLVFEVSPGVLDNNGEIVGNLNSTYVDASGQAQTFESGNYYAVLSGEGQDQEIVGVFVVESTNDPIASTTRETSGFILYR